VLVGALARDINGKSNDASLIMRIAAQIPEEQVPDKVMKAANVFLDFCNGARKRPNPWMLARRKP
jgi:hypothetical protein